MNKACDTCKSFMNPFDRYICESCIRNDHYSPAPKAFWKTGFDKCKYNEEEMAMVKLSKPGDKPDALVNLLLNSTYGAYGQYKPKLVPEIKKVIFNDPATIVLWSDNTKTVVKADGEIFDQEKGLAMAIAKKALGNEGNYFEVFKKWVDYDEEDIIVVNVHKDAMSINEVASVLATGDK